MSSISQELRQAVLQSAIQGKLTEQLPEDGDARDFLKQVDSEKERLIKEKKIKKEKPLIPISEDEMPFDIPGNWEWVRLRSLINVYGGLSYNKENLSVKSEDMVVVLRGGNIFDLRYSFRPDDVVIDRRFVKNESLYLQKNQFITPAVTSQQHLGKIARIDKSYNNVVAGGFVLNLVPYLDHDVFSKYFVYAFSNPYMRQRCNDIANKSGQAFYNLSREKLLDSVFPLPPLAEQHRIVVRVEELMAQIDELEKVENELRALHKVFPGDMKNALLQAAMQGKLTEQLPEDGNARDLLASVKKITCVSDDDVAFDIPQNWAWSFLSDVAEMYTGNSISDTEKARKYVGLADGYDYIGTKDVGFDHVITYNNGVKIPYSNDKFRHAYTDATLLCIEGGSAGRKIAILDRVVCFGNKLCMFYSTIVDKRYLYYYLQSPDFRSAFENNVTGIIGGVSIKKLKSMLIPIPPLAEQKRIVEQLDRLSPLCDSLQTEM